MVTFPPRLIECMLLRKNITLSEQFLNQILKYHIVGTVPESNTKIPHCRNSSWIKYKHTTLSEKFLNPIKKIPHCRNSSWIKYKNITLSEQFLNQIQIYHIVGTVPESNTKISHYRNSSWIQCKNATLSEQFLNPIEQS